MIKSIYLQKERWLGYNRPNSINRPLWKHRQGKSGGNGLRNLPGEAWIEQDVDILIPAALENQITQENVGKISPRVKVLLKPPTD